jgi:hypothetical protein
LIDSFFSIVGFFRGSFKVAELFGYILMMLLGACLPKILMSLSTGLFGVAFSDAEALGMYILIGFVFLSFTIETILLNPILQISTALTKIASVLNETRIN